MMRAQAASVDHESFDPLLALEAAAEGLGWPCLRSDARELVLSAALPSLDVQLGAQWLAADGLLQLSAMWDMRVPPARRRAVLALVQLANTRLPLGHFELWESAGTVVFRHAQLMIGSAAPDPAQARALLERVARACARFHPAFQFVIWAGKTPEQALEMCLFETLGEA